MARKMEIAQFVLSRGKSSCDECTVTELIIITILLFDLIN